MDLPSSESDEAGLQGCRVEDLRVLGFKVVELRLFLCVGFIVHPKKLETGLRTNRAGIPYTLLLRIEALGFPTFGLLL